MKYFFAILILFAEIEYSNAQPTRKNEIGLGVGSLDYTYAAGKNTLLADNKKLIFSSALSHPSYLWYEVESEVKLSSPSLYYSRSLSPHLYFSVSYQFNTQRGSVSPFVDPDNEPKSTYTFKNNNHDIQFGPTLIFLQRKGINPILGIGFHLDIYDITYKSESLASIYAPLNMISSTFFPFLATGIRVNLSRKYSIKFEASLSPNSNGLLFRPINRLSFNYRF